MVAAKEVRIVWHSTGARRLTFRASLLGMRPIFEAEHFVAYYTSLNSSPKVATEWIRQPVWRAFALIFVWDGKDE